MARSEVRSTASMASTPTGVTSVPPALTVGRLQYLKATVTEPSLRPGQNVRGNSTPPLSSRGRLVVPALRPELHRPRLAQGPGRRAAPHADRRSRRARQAADPEGVAPGDVGEPAPVRHVDADQERG